jgi:hypothetical protein
MALGLFTIIHAVLAVFLIIELGLTAYRESNHISTHAKVFY